MVQVRLKQSMTQGQILDLPDAAASGLVSGGLADRVDASGLTQTGQNAPGTPQPSSPPVQPDAPASPSEQPQNAARTAQQRARDTPGTR